MHHKPVQNAPQPHLNLDVRWLEFIARSVVALLKVRTVNLAQIATELNGHAELRVVTRLSVFISLKRFQSGCNARFNSRIR